MPDGDEQGLLLPTEALLVCPECAASLAARDYETHLRQAHGLYFVHGARRSYNDALAHLLNVLVQAPREAEAWRLLVQLVREEQGTQADAVLATLLGALLARVEEDRRAAAVDGLADRIAGDGAARLTAALAASGEVAARWLALAVTARQAPPFDPPFLQPLRGLLLDRRLPVEAQFAALASLLRSAGPASPLADEFLRKLVAGLGKSHSVERLREFERSFGPLPALDALCAELEERMRMSCPHCPAKLRRPAMVRHVWDEHRLVLDGRRVRDPWAVLEDWIAEYHETGDAELLEHCRIRGTQLDPEGGLHRVHRLLLRTGAWDADARRDLVAEARERHASLCPRCYALVPLPRDLPPRAVNLRPGRLSAGDYIVEISPRGIWNTLEIRAPGRVLYRGREGRRFLTRNGATLFLAGPFVLAALTAAVAWPGNGPEVVLPVAVLVAVALVVLATVRRLWPRAGAPPERLVRHAWARLAPRLHDPEFHPDDSAFLAGLARITPPGAFRQERAPLLNSLLKRTEEAVAARVEPPGRLAALRRLMVEDAAASGADPILLVADQIARCFEGRLPLAYVEHLLDGWDADWWTRGNRVRLRVLLCDRAFEAAFEVNDLLDAGQSAPALGDVLGTDPAGLAALRLLWSQRPTRPWDHCGEARTVLDLAGDPEYAGLLARRPDLLLWQRNPDWVMAAEDGDAPMREAEVQLCAGGLWLQDVCFTAPLAVIEETYKAFGGTLVLSGRRFRGAGDIDALARRMERWFRFAFHDFLPRTTAVRTWQSPERAAILRAWGAAPCPECGRSLLPRVGAIGVALAEAAPAGER